MFSVPQFRLRTLFLLTAFIAFSLAVLKSPSEFFTVVVTNAGVGMLTFAVIGAIVARTRSRAFWRGFAVVAFGYLILLSWAWDRLLWNGDQIYHPDCSFVTETILWELFDAMNPGQHEKAYRIYDNRPFSGGVVPVVGDNGSADEPIAIKADDQRDSIRITIGQDERGNIVQIKSYEWVDNFRRTGQWLFVIYFGGIGGTIAVWMVGRKPGSQETVA